MAVSKEEILDAIANMTVLDVVELIKAMEDKFGVTAAAPVAVAAMPAGGAAAAPKADVKKSKHVKATLASRQKERELESAIEDQFTSGRLLACISSRPGQSGRCDGYVLEGKELEFYQKKLQKKKGKTA